jgi:hypothetical protein
MPEDETCEKLHIIPGKTELHHLSVNTLNSTSLIYFSQAMIV